jgi:hypothetical protein
MAFKIKDLMISVLAAKGAGQKEICDDSCPELSCDIGTNGCDLDNSGVNCEFCSIGCTDCTDPSCECSDGTFCDVGGCTDPSCLFCSQGCTICTDCTGCSICSNCTGCTHCTNCTCTKCTHCSVHTCTFHTACTVCSRNSCEASARLPVSTRLRASDLPKLKAQLQRALKQVEAREQAVAKKLQPQTVEQIEILETKLREALDELARQKKELPAKEKKDKPGGETKNPKK